MSPEAITAFFAGLTAVLSSGIALWVERRRAEQECEKRIAMFREGLKEGRR
jgi:hypothetical protein